MPKIARTLTALEVKHLGPGTHCVGGVVGLYIFKSPNQSYFFYRYRDSASKRHELSLGSYPEMSIADARRQAYLAREAVQQGQDPLAARRQHKGKRGMSSVSGNSGCLFKEVALDWIEDRAKNGYWVNNIKGERETTQILEKHVFPHLGTLDVARITPEDVKKCLSLIWQNYPSTAKKARTYIQKIFQWSIAMHRQPERENPARMDGALGVLMEPLQRNRKPSQNHAACAVDEIPRLFAESRAYTSMSARATEFAILTASRSQAVRLATWDEIDLEAQTWTIPESHDKIKKPNRDRTIYLSTAAISLLKNLPRTDESSFVFPSSQGSHFSDVALTMYLRGLHQARLETDGIGWIDPVKSKQLGKPCVITLHGTARSTFRTWAKDDTLGNNRRFDQEAVELCLLHMKQDEYNGAYDRARLPKERRKIMEAWGKYCTSANKKIGAKH